MIRKIAITLCLLLIAFKFSFSNNREIVFIENRGQVVDTYGNPRPDILFTAESGGTKVFFAKDGIRYVQSEISFPMGQTDPTPFTEKSIKLFRGDLDFVGSNAYRRIEFHDPTPYTYNYFLPHCPDGITDVRCFRKITYKNVYNKIDLCFYTQGKKLKYDFIVRPGGNPKDIQMRTMGFSSTRVDAEGQLEMLSSAGMIREKAPVSYTTNKTGTFIQSNVRTKFVCNNGKVTFDVGTYDRSKVLIIDPEIEWATYYGGSNFDQPFGMDIDDNGNIHISGATFSPDLPVTPGAFQDKHKGNDEIFTAKFGPDGQLIWGTFIGSSANDGSTGLALSKGAVWVCGESRGADFPVTTDAAQSDYKGGTADAALIKLSREGYRLYATYYGSSDGCAGDLCGTGYDSFCNMIIDKNGDIVTVGRTTSPVYPVTNNAMNRKRRGVYDATIAKFDPNGGLMYASLFGGSNCEFFEDIAVDENNNYILTGFTNSLDFPATNTQYKNTNGTDYDAIIVKFDDQFNMKWSGCFGGSNEDHSNAVTVCPDGGYVISGQTESANLHVSTGAFQSAKGHGIDQFITKFDQDGNILWSTFLGGQRDEGTLMLGYKAGNAFCDIGGNIYISGSTTSEDMPVTVDGYQKVFSGDTDSFIAKFNSSGDLSYLTYLGGSYYDKNNNIALDPDGTVYALGITRSANFPVTEGAFMQSINGDADGYLVKFNVCSKEAFNYPGTASAENFIYRGDALAQANGLSLTNSTVWNAGAVWYEKMVPVKYGFTANFKFRFYAGKNPEAYDDNSAPGADGIAFVIQNHSIDALGEAGFGIGYKGMPNSLAVEFDTYANDEKALDNMSDPNGNHIAVFCNGPGANTCDHASAAELGSNMFIEEILTDSTEYFARVVYDYHSKNLKVFFDKTAEFDQPVLSLYGLDLSGLLNLHDGTHAWIGFTSATGNCYEIHEITGWDICPKPVPKPVGIIETPDNARTERLRCYPNPFGKSTSIDFTLQKPARVAIKAMAITGRSVSMIENAMLGPGTHSYEWAAKDIPAGVYYIILDVGGERFVTKVIRQ